jgi:hypothetical protein
MLPEMGLAPEQTSASPGRRTVSPPPTGRWPNGPAQ